MRSRSRLSSASGCQHGAPQGRMMAAPSDAASPIIGSAMAPNCSAPKSGWLSSPMSTLMAPTWRPRALIASPYRAAVPLNGTGTCQHTAAIPPRLISLIPSVAIASRAWSKLVSRKLMVEQPMRSSVAAWLCEVNVISPLRNSDPSTWFRFGCQTSDCRQHGTVRLTGRDGEAHVHTSRRLPTVRGTDEH